MLSRNRELVLLLAAFALASCICIAAAGLAAGSQAAICVLACSVVLGVVVGVSTRARYRAIGRLSHELDQCLNGTRRLNLAQAREGELAILSNEIDKVFQRLAITTEQLEAERTLLSDSLADISHQLKTPLTSLSIMTDLVHARIVEDGTHLTEKDVADLAERLRAIEGLQERVSWLVSALLKLARMDAGTIALAHATVGAGDVVKGAIAPLAIPFDLADVALITRIDDKASFTGDLSWSIEALQNVLKNSLEHTPAGGTVTIDVVEDPLACRLIVTDTGPGIDEEDLPHIFERFYRGSAKHAESAEVNPAGVGIGLALARSLVVAQDGRIRARNVRDTDGTVTGAQFEIAFFKATV